MNGKTTVKGRPSRTLRAVAIAATVLLTMGIAATAVAAQDEDSDRPVILAGASLTLAPFTFIDENGENVGFELDILRAVGDKLGLDFAFVRVPFSQNFNSLNANIFDVSAAAAFMRCERLQNPEGVGEFTVPTYTAGQAVSTRVDMVDAINSVADLDGLTVGVESLGSTADIIVDDILAGGANFTKEVFPDNPSLFLALEQGRIDAAMQGEFSSLWIAADNPAVGLAFRVPDTDFPVGFLFRQGDPRRAEFNTAINELKEEGVLADIYRKWFNEEPDPNGVTVQVVPEVTAASAGCAEA
jgi:ABC-type amino acid transport substrate-binding protein